MKKILFVILVLCTVPVFSQFKNEGLTSSSTSSKLDAYKINSLRHDALINKTNDSDLTGNENTVTGSKKSPGLAFIYSLFVPGMGQLYAKRFDVGKYFLISEASLWLGYAAFSIYGNWLLDDAYSYAVTHAGISNDGKDKEDAFYVDIGNYDNYEQYNNYQLAIGQYNKLYLPSNGYYFYWDQVANRRKYREDKLAADRTKNDRIFVIGAILVNHVISAVSAVMLTNEHNDRLKNKPGGFTMNADVMKFGSRVDGVKLNFVKWF
jgi:hypothetical protein